jgi:DNA-binding transcriptional LysR family regulator
MLDGIEALMALEKYETVSEAALRLRLTQSAVSKRIQALQLELKSKLVEPDGRRLKLTPAAYAFLSKARPLMIEIKNLSLNPDPKILETQFSLALADSIAGSFGPRLLNESMKPFKHLRFDIHVHRSLMLLENVALGKYQMGICTFSDNRKDLSAFHLVDEPLAIVFSEQKTRINKNLPIITIEENSATWKSVGSELKREQQSLFQIPPIHVESFMAVYQMARVGLGNGIIPLGLCKELKLKKHSYKVLKTSRPIFLVTRKTIAQLEIFTPFYDELKINCKKYFNDINS